jgi:hypothetical protein
MAFADLVLGIDRAALAHLGGGDVVYQPAVGAPVTVKGIFSESLFDEAAFWSGQAPEQAPFVFLRIADLPVNPDEDDPTLTIAGREFCVRGRIADGLGGIRLFLAVPSG